MRHTRVPVIADTQPRSFTEPVLKVEYSLP